MTIMTRLESLSLCLEHWQGIKDYVKNGYLEKMPGYHIKSKAIKDMGYENILNNCFACEYAKQFKIKNYCMECPLYDYKGKDIMCETEYNPYQNLCAYFFDKDVMLKGKYVKNIVALSVDNYIDYIRNRIYKIKILEEQI